ncbi:DMT family transporter [Vibrio mexicanus]|uniref:DMT family transporter n=1 Tax=Vibrio mexicanus TaxID=1004326 RepID=UPI00069BD10A|nr:DMT family transporter [Vibrio mexicanus]
MTTTVTDSPTERTGPPQSLNQHRFGVILALVGCLLFSLKPVMVKLAYQAGGDPASIMSLRAFSSLPAYLAILIYLARSAENRAKIRSNALPAIAIGVLGYYAASYLDIAALAFISAQLERLLIYLFPTFVVLISWFIFKQKPSKKTVFATAIGYLGVSIIVMHDFSQLGKDILVGSGLAVASALAFAFYLVWSKPLISRMGSQIFTSIGMGSAGVAILIHLQVSGAVISDWSAELVTIGVLLGIFCTVIPSYLISAAMARLTPSELSLSSNVGPLITAIFAVTILDEPFGIYHIIGMVLVIYSVYKVNQK